MTEAHPFDLCLAGEISAPVAVARLLLDGKTPDEVVSAAASRRNDSQAWRTLADVVSRTDLLAHTASVAAAGFDHVDFGLEPHEAVAAVAGAFDRLVGASPELSVAAYCLGDPALLQAASEEVADWLVSQRLISVQACVLDIGCGIGRMESALAGLCRTIVAIDVSPAMLAEARRRCAAPNVRFELTQGADLASLADGVFDLVLAVDSFPYLVQAGGEIARRHVIEAARVLRPGGVFAVLNFSYRTPAEDEADARAWASAAGLAVRSLGAKPFRIWDGAAYVFERP